MLVHINLCYLSEGLGWHQQETNKELIEEGRAEEDAYYIHNVPRDIGEADGTTDVQCAKEDRLSVRVLLGRNWLNGTNPESQATPEVRSVALEELWSNCSRDRMSRCNPERRHSRIKALLLTKERLAGQVIQWEEANYHSPHRNVLHRATTILQSLTVF